MVKNNLPVGKINNPSFIIPDINNSKNDVKVEGIDTPLFSSVKNLSPFRQYQRLDDQVLRLLYHRSPQIRLCIDGIVGEISSRTPKLIPLVDNISKDILTKLEIFSYKFFGKVNRKKDSIRVLISKIVRDLLVHDRFFIEKVRDRNGRLVELYARDPLYIVIDKNEHGVINNFRQIKDTYEIKFNVKDIIYAPLHACSYDDYGIPIIEGIVDEVASLLLATRTIANYIFDDSVPPGLLVLGEIGEVAYERLKQEFKDPNKRNQIKVIRNIKPENINWLRLDRSISSESKIDYLLDRLEKIILKSFQIPTDRELGSRGSAEIAYKVSQSKLIDPIIKIIEEKFTKEIFEEEFGLPVKFKLFKMADLDSTEFYENSRAVNLMVNNGILTVNEAREILGFMPISGGSRRLAKLGNEIITFDDTGMPKRSPDFVD